MSADAVVTLGRDGMGPEADESDYLAWVAYVENHIDDATGLDVRVDTRSARDVQDDAIRVYRDGYEEADVHDALQSLWEAFCADPTAWPNREWAS